MGAGQRVRVTREIRLPDREEVPGDEGLALSRSLEGAVPVTVRLTDDIRLAVAT